MSLPFVFKQFELSQSQSAFKLGTDSVILGAWLPDKAFKKILDVGGGSGIISLMMAQRFKQAKITSVEIDPGSSADSANNFTQSAWSQRLTSFNADIFIWSNTHTSEKFDLIISNPPYFSNSLQNPDPRKAYTRHTGDLNPKSMATLIHTHLAPGGYFACILPSDEFEVWKKIFASLEVYPVQVCYIRSFKDSRIVRTAGLFTRTKQELAIDDHFIYNDDKTRSNWYAGITNDFYIK